MSRPAAPAGLPCMLPDYHIHTALCQHATGLPSEYYGRAAVLGLPHICFTDHVPAPDGYDPRNRMTLDQYPRYRALVAALPDAPDPAPRVHIGIEVDYYDGGLPFLREWLPRQDLDFVLGSVHYLDRWGFDNPGERAVWDAVDVTETWRAYFRLIGKLADTRLANAVAHLDLPKKFGYRPPERDLRDMSAPALDRIAAAGMAIEINSSGLSKPVGEIYPSLPLLIDARARGIPICFGSDAHSPDRVGYRFDASLALARSAGYTRAVRFHGRRAIPYDLPPERLTP